MGKAKHTSNKPDEDSIRGNVIDEAFSRIDWIWDSIYKHELYIPYEESQLIITDRFGNKRHIQGFILLDEDVDEEDELHIDEYGEPFLTDYDLHDIAQSTNRGYGTNYTVDDIFNILKDHMIAEYSPYWECRRLVAPRTWQHYPMDGHRLLIEKRLC